MSESRVNQSCMIIKANNQSLNHKVAHVRPPPQPVYFAWINITDFIIPELWKIHSCLLESRGIEDCSKDGIKTIGEEIGFLKFIWKIGVSKVT